MKKRNSITVAVLDLKFCRFSSDLVHRHIIFLLTLLLLEKQMIISPDNAFMIIQAVPMSKQVNRVNVKSEILNGNWSSYWKYNEV